MKWRRLPSASNKKKTKNHGSAHNDVRTRALWTDRSCANQLDYGELVVMYARLLQPYTSTNQTQKKHQVPARRCLHGISSTQAAHVSRWSYQYKSNTNKTWRQHERVAFMFLVHLAALCLASSKSLHKRLSGTQLSFQIDGHKQWEQLPTRSCPFASGRHLIHVAGEGTTHMTSILSYIYIHIHIYLSYILHHASPAFLLHDSVV